MRNEPQQTDLARVIRDARIARGWSQESLAEMAGVGRQTIARLELGQQGISLANLYKILGVLSLHLAAESTGQQG